MIPGVVWPVLDGCVAVRCEGGSEGQQLVKGVLRPVRLDAGDNGPIIPTLQPDQLPREFQIFHAGANATNKGIFLFDRESANAVMAEFRAQGVQKFVDWDHQAASEPPTQAPAAGWFDLEVRGSDAEPELWATNVRWTPEAAGQLARSEYRHFSPWFDVDSKTGRVMRLRNLALVNYPATQRQQPLVAASATAADGAPTMNKCASCGTEIPAGATACPKCGAQVAAAAPPVAAPAAAAAPGAGAPVIPAAAPPGAPGAVVPQKCATCSGAIPADQPVACMACMERATAANAAKMAAAQGLTAAQLSGRTPGLDDVIASARVDASVRQQVLVIAGVDNIPGAIGALHAIKAKAAQVDAITGERDTLQQKLLQVEANALITSATEGGKLAPAQQAWARGLVCADPAKDAAGKPLVPVAADGKHYTPAGLQQLQGFLGVAPTQVTLAGAGAPAPAGTLPVPGEIAAVARALRVDPAEVAANIQRRTGQDAGVALSGRATPRQQ